MCGLPPSLSDEEWVELYLNLDRLRWRKIDDMVQAIRIANGALPPEAYYTALIDDPVSAGAKRGSDMLEVLMRNTHGRR